MEVNGGMWMDFEPLSLNVRIKEFGVESNAQSSLSPARES